MIRLKNNFGKVLLVIIAVAFLAGSIPLFVPQVGQAYADDHADDMRAIWISTVWSADFPSVKDNAVAQKKEFSDKLDKLQAAGFNTVVVQVRPKADAFYKSDINPWSEVITGTQGRNPGYDPMEYMIQEAHNRGMSFHAWLNPYRITTSGTDVNVLAANHPARLHPEWTITCGNALYYNPDLAEVRQHICDTVAEIVDNYDVDGIHFDDYFYPSNYPLPAGETRDGATGNTRRANVNQMVSDIYNTIQQHDSSVLFGISPFGIWKNNTSDPAGSATAGAEGYYSVCGDARAWLQAGIIDYLVPQIYWETGFSKADYETLVSWWSNLVAATNSNVKLYIGQGIYRDAVASEISKQLTINDKYSNIKGEMFFSAKDIFENRMGCADTIRTYYSASNSSGIVTPQTSPATVTAFTDVAANAWYANDVASAVSLGIINGMGDGTFNPDGNLRVAEALTMAVKVHSRENNKTFIAGGTNWYDNAVAYAVQNSIINADDFSDCDKLISRDDMAYIFANVLSYNENVLNTGFIVPDIGKSNHPGQVLDLYEKGILTGSGDNREFKPQDNIKRSEAAAIINRLAVDDNRVKF